MFRRRSMGTKSGEPAGPIDCLPALMEYVDGKLDVLQEMLREDFSRNQIEQVPLP